MGLGILIIVGVILNWRIIMSPGKLIPRLLGPTGAKNFLLIIGLPLIGFGVSLMLG
jgi:small neutral amino acid transporter SnatA (MarC family)